MCWDVCIDAYQMCLFGFVKTFQCCIDVHCLCHLSKEFIHLFVDLLQVIVVVNACLNKFSPLPLALASQLLWRKRHKNKVTPLLAAPWIPCILFYAFSSFCEPLYTVLCWLSHFGTRQNSVYFPILLDTWFCGIYIVFSNSTFPSPSGKRFFFGGRVQQRFDFTCSCVFCTTCLTRQESYLCFCPCCVSTQNFASSASAFRWFRQLCFCFRSLLECTVGSFQKHV